MKIQLTSKKQASLLKAASVEPEREIEEDILSPIGEEESANLEQLGERASRNRAPTRSVSSGLSDDATL